ncbi:hypothetical protein [Variovorax sp. J31P207]|uniref:hypothetical protein n=1 Tax=Variovorax sp. J31P207 TaxID=3053510 RepID=UPI0033654660
MFTTRPGIIDVFGVASSTHRPASRAATGVERAGNASRRATVAGGLMLQVVEPQFNGPGDVVPILQWRAIDQPARCVDVQAWASAPATPVAFAQRGFEQAPGYAAAAEFTLRRTLPMLPVTVCLNLLDELSQAQDLDSAMRQVDAYRRLLVGPGEFSINLNVTTADDPPNEVQLRRIYSSNGGQFPVAGRKRKLLNRWTRTLFGEGRVFVAEGAPMLAELFDDYEHMAPLGLNAAINVPLLQGKHCVATFNVFGTRGCWQDQEILAARLLATAAARWVTPAPGLHYTLDAEPA